ncbi:hypothetical protein N0V88_003478 [Collariella sp. IMI 366227]|nr:hypothetical protein N0V88_003478 [Collariella sp. IMI 366227]
MAGRPGNRSSQTQAMPPAAPRQNEYFVPRDGIDREVITSDICRYLGNDALVRPGTYESPDGRVTQGYFITAYRNLTSAMIQDLKADSARWEQERRAASRSSAGGGAREQRGQSDYSAWKKEQEYQAQYGSAMDIDYAPPASAAGNPVYAGQPYPGAPPASYPPTAYPAPAHAAAAAAAQYQAQPAYGYAPNPPPTQYSPQPQTVGDSSRLMLSTAAVQHNGKATERPPDAQYDDMQNPALQPVTTPTGAAPAQMANGGAQPVRRDRDRDSEPREREQRDDRHADRNRHRHR